MGAVKNADILIKVAVVLDDAVRSIKNLKGRFKGLGSTLKQNELRFQGWAMSIMFFGMAIQRVFTQIWKTSSKTFQEISHSVEGTTTGFDMLEGSVKFLGFTIGSALEPIAQRLIPIIDRVSDWVTENESLARSIIKWGTVIGATFFVVGTLTLGFGGLYTMVSNVGTLIAATFGVSGIAGSAAFKFGSIVFAIVASLFYIVTLSKKIGGFWELLKAVGRGVLKVFAGLGYAILAVMEILGNGIKQIWNWVIELSENWIQGIIDKINLALSLANMIPGVNIKLLGDVDFSGAKAEIKSMSDIWGGFLNNMANVESDLNTLIPMDNGVSTGSLFNPQFAEETLAPTPQTVVNNYQQTIDITAESAKSQEIIDEFKRLANQG